MGIKRERQSTIFHCLQREGLWEVEQLEINEGAEPEQMCGGKGRRSCYTYRGSRRWRSSACAGGGRCRCRRNHSVKASTQQSASSAENHRAHEQREWNGGQEGRRQEAWVRREGRRRRNAQSETACGHCEDSDCELCSDFCFRPARSSGNP